MKLKLLKLFDKLIGCYLQLLKLPTSVQAPEQIHNIAIIKLSAMGDVLCLMPAIRQLKQWYPNAYITLNTTHRSNPSLFKHLAFIDAIELIPTSPFSLISFIKTFKKKHYDLCIDADQYYNISTFLALKSHYSVGFITPAKPNRLNKSLRYDTKANEKIEFLKLIAYACNKATPSQLDVTLPELIPSHQVQEIQQQINPYLHTTQAKNIIIYPGSSGNADFRRWHIENYKEVINQLCELGHAVYIAGGPDEINIYNEFNALCEKHSLCTNLINKLTLPAWLYFMQHHGTLFIGNDAGLLHIAEASGIPIIGIFGPNIYSKWGSLNTQSTGIEIPIETLPCRPCIINSKGQIPQQCHRGDNACLTRISPKQVLLEIEHFISSI